MRDFNSIIRQRARRAIALVCTVALGVSLAACGSSNSGSSDKSSSSSSSSSSSVKLTAMTGISAEGELGKEPKVSFKTPLNVKNYSYQVLQKGNGDKIEDGDRLCVQQIAYDAETGKQLENANTWTTNTPECSMVMNTNAINQEYYDLFKGRKVNTTIAFGFDDSSSASASASSSSDGITTATATKYIIVLTVVSKSKALTRATGEKVTDIPADLPKVTLDKNGKPSIDMNNYKPGDQLVVQTLIKGSGKEVKDTDTVSANYTGWLASNGKQFDSSWDRGAASDFSLDQVIKGWKQGLAGQTVGSQVLLIIPADLAYGSTEQNGIPANSTLVFVVDILDAY
ncbi:FKBP-type peptidyl-prolyl cis-trans isomerase [Bifidobacterium vansinderenii]|uniref:peptidylprolyl isomerase n=1 Tax=Bifidobacterium vansinderenii TaxID=1984871 RepID=A0A229VXB2_9BIFI|nr:FKBP-type peptidyl-prolyl cis-trans isomerase [Bifidobacterium vansinderenii]OXN00261.1 peptidylprolyl isomerase [Bifidobacterium vansinderenii]